jgi:hypothetical protein
VCKQQRRWGHRTAPGLASSSAAATVHRQAEMIWSFHRNSSLANSANSACGARVLKDAVTTCELLAQHRRQAGLLDRHHRKAIRRSRVALRYPHRPRSLPRADCSPKQRSARGVYRGGIGWLPSLTLALEVFGGLDALRVLIAPRRRADPLLLGACPFLVPNQPSTPTPVPDGQNLGRYR